MSIETRERAARNIFEGGSFKIDLETGFKIALHDDLPEAPLSPFYLNLRPDGVKEGVLTKEDIVWIALSMHQLCKRNKLFTTSRPICSIPAAGDPFLDEMLDIMERASSLDRNLLPKRIRLKKIVPGKRPLALDESSQGAWQNTLLVDDLVASLLTKNLAIGAIEGVGGSVTDLLVFLNRSADARARLAARGITLHAVWEFEHLMEWALGQGYLTRTQHEVIMEYPATLAAYKRSVGYDK